MTLYEKAFGFLIFLCLLGLVGYYLWVNVIDNNDDWLPPSP